MGSKIKLLMFGESVECEAAVEIVKALPELSEYTCECFQLNDLEVLVETIVDLEPTLLIVLANGAEGMECVYRTRERTSELPVFWFSDDKAFAVQSYRFNCAYFTTKPVTSDKMSSAIKRCSHIGIQI